MSTTRSAKLKKTPKCTDMSVEDALIQSLSSVRDTLKSGKRLEVRYTMRTFDLELEPQDYGPGEIRATRERLMASQALFAKLLGTKLKTLQSWEQGLEPPPMARRLFDIINADPKPWLRILQKSSKATKEPSSTRKRSKKVALKR